MRKVQLKQISYYQIAWLVSLINLLLHISYFFFFFYIALLTFYCSSTECKNFKQRVKKSVQIVLVLSQNEEEISGLGQPVCDKNQRATESLFHAAL